VPSGSYLEDAEKKQKNGDKIAKKLKKRGLGKEICVQIENINACYFRDC
jgi:hypothetical protein